MSSAIFSELSVLFEEYLQAQQPNGMPDSLYEPVRYINDLGGKRIRPILVLLGYQLYHDDCLQALPAALAVEYFHNFSLIHDDIMDEAPLRRGKEPVHIHFGRNSAILSGDVMLIRSFQLLLEAGKHGHNGSELCELMAAAAVHICEGQQMDMDFELLASPTEAEYMEMIRRKTACLLGTSLQMGAVLAGAPQNESDALYRFGEKIGLSFQIQDDYLDIYGDPQRTGKVQSGDILRGKKNFLYVHTWNQLSSADQVRFQHVYGQAGRDHNISTVLSVYHDQKVDTYTKEVQEKYFEEAMGALHAVAADKSSILAEFANSLAGRNA